MMNLFEVMIKGAEENCDTKHIKIWIVVYLLFLNKMYRKIFLLKDIYLRWLEAVSTLSRDLVIRRIDTTTFYHVTAMLWYHVKHQLLLNKIQLFSWCNKLSWKQESFAKTHYILVLVAHICKTKSVIPIFYCTEVTSMPEWNFLQSWKRFYRANSELP